MLQTTLPRGQVGVGVNPTLDEAPSIDRICRSVQKAGGNGLALLYFCCTSSADLQFEPSDIQKANSRLSPSGNQGPIAVSFCGVLSMGQGYLYIENS